MSKSNIEKYLVTDASPRAQTVLGRYAAHGDTDTRKFGHMFAAVGGTRTSGFPHIGQAVNEGLPWGPDQNRRCRWDEFQDNNGKPHDITLENGTVLRQLVCPTEVLEHKTRMEAQDSTDMCSRERILSTEQIDARAKANEFASRQVEELTYGQEEILRQPTALEQMPPKHDNMAKARAALAAKRAAKTSQPQHV